MVEKGQKIIAKVTAIVNYGAFCEIIDNDETIKGLIHISEISDFYVKSISEFLETGKEYEVEVIDFSKDKNQVKLSYKSIRPELLKIENSKIKETTNGFDNLKKSVK
ncbi:S1 RNA binding domain protein [Spiroplasma litorale]|uniref:S1 RNA binding domain protein n=1 Tax=Spiroplasma litorale TaxID=216942 RepID=A0A0K1W143_9MOLU|nr:S1 RNA-binding domain-containing protein [Spiroplasma litorale]AKX33888.1 S1 RNA binding domain protein [Spiroplasma litorale]